MRGTRRTPNCLPPKPRPTLNRARPPTAEGHTRLDKYSKRHKSPAMGHEEPPFLATRQQLQQPKQSQNISKQMHPEQLQTTRGRGKGRNLVDGREYRNEQKSAPALASVAYLPRVLEEQEKEIENLRSKLYQCLRSLTECQTRLATIEKERNEERREMRQEGEEECDRISFVSSKSNTTPMTLPVKTVVMESSSFSSSSISFASQAKSATAAGCLGRPVYPEKHSGVGRQENPSVRGAVCSSSCSAVGHPVQETKETPRRSNSCAALRRPVVAAPQGSAARKNNKRATSARPSVNDSHLREIKRHAGTDIPVLRWDVEGHENAPPAGQENSTPRPCCAGNRDTQKTPVSSSPSSFAPASNFQNYHKAKKPLALPVELNADMAQKMGLHTLRCCKHSISTASAHNNFAVQSYFQRLEKSIKESIERKTGSVIGQRPEQRAQANKNVDEFSVFGAPPAFVAGDVFNQLDYCRLSDQSKKGHKLMSFVENRGFDIYYGTEMARVVGMQQMSVKAARGNFPEAASWGVKASIDEKNPPPGNEEYLFSDLVDEYFSSDTLEKNNRLNWRQHPVSDEHKQWVRNYMNMNVSLANLVYDPEVCFCPTPDPLVKWQWNFKKQPSNQATGQGTNGE
eukprot:GHVS01106155.1.p1 GENE.GHVS01106155.1~~GHVS01106155.1.p1  ORF type:complete len:627 (-),score=90.33 GHVS01106155.1:335-2215(-)